MKPSFLNCKLNAFSCHPLYSTRPVQSACSFLSVASVGGFGAPIAGSGGGSSKPRTRIDRALARFGPMPIRCHRLEADWNGEPMLNLSAFLGMPATATPPDETFDEGDDCPLGPGWSILHLPGHSPGSSAFLHGPTGTLIAGDTLFAGSIGRIDFPTSDPQAMRVSIERMMTLDDAVRVLPGHGPRTTIGQERAGNPFIRDGAAAF